LIQDRTTKTALEAAMITIRDRAIPRNKIHIIRTIKEPASSNMGGRANG
jgi:hypothetical protein